MALHRRALLMSVGALAACAPPPTAVLVPPAMPRLTSLPREQEPPPAPREFRGAWVASVDNIDWPSAPGLTVDEQQAQARRIVQRASALGLNALLLQVRPAADALYASALEPASEYLSGTQGVAPPYDPLAWWIGLCHGAGIELHAWFNPFRARHPSARSPLAATHIARRQPDWAKRYGDALWLDPGEPGVVAHTLAVIGDVVQRYDIDGVHLDDYFYPYPVQPAEGGEMPFPDDASYARARTALPRADWRRDNVNRFVQALYAQVHAIKPWLKVGISPFALPRAARRQGPAQGIEGFDPHAKLYADAERWLDQGWLDYCSPQLYWPLARRAQAFDALLEHWALANIRARHLWPGLFTSRVPADEIERQLMHLRAHPDQAGGHIHFSMVALMDDRGGLSSRLQAAVNGPALVPATPWLGSTPPLAPLCTALAQGATIRPQDAETRWLAVWQRRAGAWRLSVHDARAVVVLPWGDGAGALDALAVSSLGRSGVHSERLAFAVMRHH